MRHGNARSRLSRNRSLRKATLRDIAKALILHQSIKTTKAKAKEARRLVDRLISLGKRQDLSARRLAFVELCDHNLVSLLFNEIAPRFKDRNGGYTRIINWVNRRGDNAKNVVLELTQIKVEEKVKQAKPKEEKPEKIEKVISPKEKPAPPKAEEKLEVKTKEPAKEKQKVKEVKPPKKFMGGLRKFFKKERDSL